MRLFAWAGVLYNLLAEFRETVLPRSWFERAAESGQRFCLFGGRRSDLSGAPSADSICDA